MISMKQFYLYASILMVVSVIFNIWNLVSAWALMNLPAKFSFIFGNIFFQLLLIGMFIGMYRVTPDMILKDNPELDDVLKKLEKEVQ